VRSLVGYVAFRYTSLDPQPPSHSFTHPSLCNTAIPPLTCVSAFSKLLMKTVNDMHRLLLDEDWREVRQENIFLGRVSRI
jgi:hypothetical protein